VLPRPCVPKAMCSQGAALCSQGPGKEHEGYPRVVLRSGVVPKVELSFDFNNSQFRFASASCSQHFHSHMGSSK